jgi:hypothetical protein
VGRKIRYFASRILSGGAKRFTTATTDGCWVDKKRFLAEHYGGIVMGIVENHSDTFFTHSCIKARKEHSGIETY